MPDILPRDLELRSPKDLRTGAFVAATDAVIGLAAGSGLCLMIGHPPFGTKLTNPSVWILLPVAIGARHGEAAGGVAGLVAWAMNAGVFTSGRLPDAAGPSGAITAFLFMMAGAAAGYLSGSMRKIAAAELAKHRAVRSAVHRANITLRMAGRVRDDLILELFRARSGGSAVAPLLRRVLMAEPDRQRDEILEYLETVHEVRSAAVYRHAGGNTWTLVTSRGAHPDGEYPEKLTRGALMAKTVRFSEEAVFAESPHTETELPLLIAPLVVEDSGVVEIVVVEDMSAERLTPRETLGVATSVEFFGLSLHGRDMTEQARFAATADALLRLRRVCGVESTLAVFADTEAGDAGCAALAARIPGAVRGRWVAAENAPALLIPGDHGGRVAQLFDEFRAKHPSAIILTAGFHEATDDVLSADEWVASMLSHDHWSV